MTYLELLNKVNMNGILAIIFTIGYFTFLFAFISKAIATSETLSTLLGIMSTVMILIAQYYFRKAPKSNSTP